MSQRTCPECHTAVFDELPGGLCPSCLMAAAQKSRQNVDATRARSGEAGVPDVAEITALFPELEVTELIGHGGMGAVYRVRQRNLDRVVALKVFLPDRDDPEFAARFQREARALAKLNHPNIVTVHDFGQRGHLHFLLMEFVDGLNLRQVTLADRLSPVEALEMIPQLCDALQYAHDQGVIHRDIKPENLLLDVNGRIKIADFGLAKMTGAGHEGTLTRTQQVMGTLNYMAPEQRERPTEVDHRADIYSLGVVIYELLTGELPLGRFQPPSSMAEVNNALDDVVMRALEKEPGRRFQQASEFKTGVQSAGASPHPAAAGFAMPEATPGFQQDDATQAAYYQPSPPIKSSVSFAPSVFDETRRTTLALFSGVDKQGAWQPGRPHLAITAFGGTSLNLTDVDADEVYLNLFTIFGAAEIVVPRGATVDLNGLIVFGAIDNQVTRYDGYGRSEMRIQIRSYGAFGGCEVRTPTEKESPLPVPPGKDRLPASIDIGWFQMLLLVIYQSLGWLIALACPIMFVAGGMDILPKETANMIAIFSGFVALAIFTNLKHFRRLIGVGPEERTEEAVAEYENSNVFSTLIRMLAVLLIFACPALFIAASYEGEQELRFAGVVSAIVAVGLFALAKQLEK
jgi:serine/threonine protein kinase